MYVAVVLLAGLYMESVTMELTPIKITQLMLTEIALTIIFIIQQLALGSNPLHLLIEILDKLLMTQPQEPYIIANILLLMAIMLHVHQFNRI